MNLWSLKINFELSSKNARAQGPLPTYNLPQCPTTLQTAPVLRVTARLSPRTHRVSSSSSCRVTVTRWTAGWWYSDLEFIKWSALEFTMLTPSFTCLQTFLERGMTSDFKAFRISSILRVEELQVLDEGIVTVGVVLDHRGPVLRGAERPAGPRLPPVLRHLPLDPAADAPAAVFHARPRVARPRLARPAQPAQQCLFVFLSV